MVQVYAQLGKAREAVNLAEVLLQAGHTMEAAGWDAVVSLAWASGVVPLQRYAVQLMQRGKQYGHYNAVVSEQVRWGMPGAGVRCEGQALLLHHTHTVACWYTPALVRDTSAI
jgi:hypothetical protein